MSTPPTIVWQTSAPMQTVIANRMSYALFANDASFSNWQSWVNDSNNKNSVTTNMVENAKMFSGYALKIYCNLDGLTHTLLG